MQGPKQSKTYLSPALFVKGLFSLRPRGMPLAGQLHGLPRSRATLRACVTPANKNHRAGLLHALRFFIIWGFLNIPCRLTLSVRVCGVVWMDAGETALFLGRSVTAVTIWDLLGKIPFGSKDALRRPRQLLSWPCVILARIRPSWPPRTSCTWPRGMQMDYLKQ